ncbi:hypothetical protein TNCV_5082231 [Trichonephila clavipes]|nr:hypothetical protein TNCV_5082231 [Trichonephila clavipes]
MGNRSLWVLSRGTKPRDLENHGKLVTVGHVRMDGDHLLQCTVLDEYPIYDFLSRYWNARSQIVKRPSMSIG